MRHVFKGTKCEADDCGVTFETDPIADAETKFSEEVEKLQKTYEKLSKEKDETKERINDDDFKFAKAVKKAAAKASATDEL